MRGAHAATPRSIALLIGVTGLGVSNALAQDRPHIEVEAGPSEIIVGKTKFTARTDYFDTQVLSHVEDYDGNIGGARINSAVTGLFASNVGAFQASIAVKGFYSSYSGKQKSSCAFSATQDCAFVPLYDPSPSTVDISGGFFSKWNTSTRKDVDHFGGAVEIRLDKNGVAIGGLKDTPVVAPSGFQWRLGAAVRELDQGTRLTSIDSGPTEDPVHMSEQLNTTYYGGYLGFSLTQPLSEGYRVSLTAEGGAYVSDSRYRGQYTASALLGSGLPISEAISQSSQAPAFISKLGLSVEKEIGAVTVGLFGEGEWISHVPMIRYNEFDRASSSASLQQSANVFDLRGSQDGTAIGNTSALTYTAGVRLSVPLR